MVTSGGVARRLAPPDDSRRSRQLRGLGLGRGAYVLLREPLARRRAVAREEAARELARGLLGGKRRERRRRRQARVVGEDELAAEGERLEQVPVAAAEPGVDTLRELRARERAVAQRPRD